MTLGVLNARYEPTQVANNLPVILASRADFKKGAWPIAPGMNACCLFSDFVKPAAMVVRAGRLPLKMPRFFFMTFYPELKLRQPKSMLHFSMLDWPIGTPDRR
ncbi:hypothetical protein [Burkholderia sp. WAC0059]|uniref:hypothetical protein n=1 Tax=Burkholderia sp. WAC0059 TaxID=2066022 RepID=UPI0021552509|nr:hypothetical protein [Burkholderia sp. WAC0059]